MNHDDDLSRLLRNAVADVEPRGGLDDIRSRTHEVVPMKRWFVPTLAVAAVMAVVVGGAFWLVGDHDKTPSAAGTPTTGTSPSAGPTSSDDGQTTARAVPVYYVGDSGRGTKLFREFHSKQVPTSPDDALATAAAREALTGQAQDPDYTNPWPDGAALAGAAVSADAITLDLTGDVHDRPAGMSQAAAELAVQQLIYSAQAGLGKGRLPVQLLLDGKHTDTILGVPTAEPLAASNPDDVLAAVEIDAPVDGATVSGAFTVTGRAATFEANVVWELKQGDTVVRHGFATAQECCTLSPYSFPVSAPAGHYTLVVHDTDESGAGRPVDQDTKEITVQ